MLKKGHFSFALTDVGSEAVTMSGVTITANDTNDYSVVQQTGLSATVTPAPLTVTGITANYKTYDGTTAATLNTGSAALVGTLGPDSVTLNTAGATGIFSDDNPGDPKTVTVSGLTISGIDAGNYSLIQPTTTAGISASSPVVNAVPPSGTLIPPSGALITGESVLYRMPTFGFGMITLPVFTPMGPVIEIGEVPIAMPMPAVAVPMVVSAPMAAPVVSMPVMAPVVRTPVAAPVVSTPVAVPVVSMPVTAPVTALPNRGIVTSLSPARLFKEVRVYVEMPKILSPETFRSTTISVQINSAANFGKTMVGAEMPKLSSPGAFRSMAISVQLHSLANFRETMVYSSTSRILTPGIFSNIRVFPEIR